MNRLAEETSPYLLQHADNPVGWYPWGEEAFAEAKRRDAPVLLSVGYAACHWCHVMAHESFEDEATARLMNTWFVNVKVDREERPDVDAVYMDAVTAMTGQGGWPMTVFLTPDGEPFFAGTYYPPRRRPGAPAFTDLLTAIAQAWAEQRDAVVGQASTVVRRLADMRASAPHGGDGPPTEADLSGAVGQLSRQYDHARGGFGGVPKFPPSMVCEFLLRHHARTGDPDALLMAEGTLRAMAAGGIHDQLGGGFARYSVDAGWVVPHFEKMLYDNALLARTYLHLWRATGRSLGRHVALATCDFMVRELGTEEGGFASALDADSEGEEGRYYVWTPAQLAAVLGDDADWAAEVFSVTTDGTFEHGASTLQLLREPDDHDRFVDVRRRLAAARDARVRPARDDKVVTAWNGLAIAALAETGALLDRPDLVEAARAAADLLLRVHVVDGRLRRVSRAGEVGRPWGVLEDHGDLAEGLLALVCVTGEPRWLAAAGELLDAVLERFGDGAGGFFDTAHDAPALVSRPQDLTDSAAPSGHSAVTGALLTYAAVTGSTRHRDAASAALTASSALATSSPRFAGWSLAAAEAHVDGPREVAVVGPPGRERERLHRVALLGTSPGLVAVAGSTTDTRLPLLAGRPLIDGRPTAYVCRDFVCQAPTTDPTGVAGQVGALPGTVREWTPPSQ